MTISLQPLNDGSAKILVNGADRLIIEADGTLRGVANPPQFDADNSLATTAFVQRALGNHSASVTHTTAVNLVASDAGKFINLAGAGGQTAQLPALSSVPEGASFTFKSTSSGNWVISRNGADNITSAGSLFPNFVLFTGESVTVTKVVSGTAYWYITGECTQVYKNAASLFGATLSANGYQVLPSGLIIQWGMFSAPINSTSTIVLPTAFPNVFLSVVATCDDDVGTVTSYPFSAARRINNSSFSLRSYYSQSSIRNNWIAIGY